MCELRSLWFSYLFEPCIEKRSFLQAHFTGILHWVSVTCREFLSFNNPANTKYEMFCYNFHGSIRKRKTLSSDGSKQASLRRTTNTTPTLMTIKAQLTKSTVIAMHKTATTTTMVADWFKSHVFWTLSLSLSRSLSQTSKQTDRHRGRQRHARIANIFLKNRCCCILCSLTPSLSLYVSFSLSFSWLLYQIYTTSLSESNVVCLTHTFHASLSC